MEILFYHLVKMCLREIATFLYVVKNCPIRLILETTGCDNIKGWTYFCCTRYFPRIVQIPLRNLSQNLSQIEQPFIKKIDIHGMVSNLGTF